MKLKNILSYKIEPFSLTIETETEVKIVKTINAKSIFASIKLSEFQDSLKLSQKKLIDLQEKLKEFTKRKKLTSEELEEYNSTITSIDTTIADITLKTRQYLEYIIENYNEVKEFIYSIPENETEKFFYFLRLASLGVELNQDEQSKKKESTIVSTIESV